MAYTLSWFFGVGLAAGVGWYLGQAVVDFMLGVLLEDEDDG